MTKDPSQLYIGETVQTFLDNVLIFSAYPVTRRWHRPERANDGMPVIQKDRPWEHVPYFTYSNYAVLYDPQEETFKCWYEDLIMVPSEHRAPHVSRQLYAESKDGVHWEKPELGIVVENGEKTNIVLGSGAGRADDVHSMSVVIDPYPPTPDQRFRALFSHRSSKAMGRYRIACAYSPDGTHWTLYDEAPSFGLCGPWLDDVSVLFYDEDSREFVQNTRHFLKGPGGGSTPRGGMHHFASTGTRRIWQSRSHDFIHWSEPILVAAPGDEDNLDEQFYGMAQYKLGNLHLATMGVFRVVDNEMDVQLLMSRDGIRWKQTAKRQPFLAPRGEGHFDAHMVSMVSPPVPVGDEVWFFHGGSAPHHDWWIPKTGRTPIDHPEAKDPSQARLGLGLATLRRDGYAGLYATRYVPGWLTTQSVISEGTKLVINAKCEPRGSIQVEMCDEFDDVIEPCTMDNCDPFTGDSVEHTVTWKGNPEIPVRRWRRLRFRLEGAELFSFRFIDSRSEIPIDPREGTFPDDT